MNRLIVNGYFTVDGNKVADYAQARRKAQLHLNFEKTSEVSIYCSSMHNINLFIYHDRCIISNLFQLGVKVKCRSNL